MTKSGFTSAQEIEMGKIAPQATEIEIAVLGAILQEPDVKSPEMNARLQEAIMLIRRATIILTQ